MSIVSRVYRKRFVGRFDKEVGVPYFSYTDFKGLKQESFSFVNSKRIEIHYFYYYYDNYKKDKIILFCHGMGPGHVSYLAEIEELARRGYKVLTLDYTGCGESKGKCLGSLNAPTRDVMDLLKHLNLQTQIVLVGHSLGGFTALKVAALRKDITKAVVFAPIVTTRIMIYNASKSNFITKHVLKYERKVEKEYDSIDLPKYLGTTTDDILFIQSVDDPMVPYDSSLKVAEETNNSHIKTIKFDKRKHNPNYTESAIIYMNEVFGDYNRLAKYKKIKTDEERIAYFKDVSIKKLTEQDISLFDQIESFIG